MSSPSIRLKPTPRDGSRKPRRA